MSVLLYGFRRNERGKIEYRIFDSDNFPEGWVDSPDKIPAPQPPAPPVETVPTPVDKGWCPKCGAHIGRGIALHVKRCKG